ncbi:hypothetical protein [Paracidovorax citrulli]|uniref:Uncharacterized protein n=3 Tax=Comamonadaceae TaxID=80864 RepID=A1TS87_PARC0|nr:hypothetical protein [Paracidovorax citrulli]ABM33825.1 hypothetical protein Aave_3264 [Paracidovorax citrulli AAC00-1]ATG94404.1 hypothetical protein CQB05_10455 [Paracidovorax citrulli]MVT28371.1 hypothetical protein [Paracidovorax citrulli]PVY63261.1 hypothetical protein C8E08_0539 [Paracidovorax citrulli]QCX12448.1 hypothetical protein APS58_3724 [Paracidovorax citrulli]
MSADLAATFYTMGYGQELAKSMDSNKADILVLTFPQYFSILEDKTRNNPRLENTIRAILANTSFGKYWTGTFSPNASQPWVGPAAQSANDVLAITKTLNAIGIAGITSYVKNTASGSYIIIKGYAAHRSGALTGTRYLATNPLMLKFGLGVQSLKGIAIGGFILGVTVSTGIEVMDFIFNNEKTMYDLVGGIGVEAVKGGLGGLVAYGMGVAVGSFTAVAVAPLVTMAFFAFLVGAGLNYADEQYQIKSRVISALKSLPENTKQGLYRINENSESWLNKMQSRVQSSAQKTGQELADWLCPICRRY